MDGKREHQAKAGGVNGVKPVNQRGIVPEKKEENKERAGSQNNS